MSVPLRGRFGVTPNNSAGLDAILENRLSHSPWVLRVPMSRYRFSSCSRAGTQVNHDTQSTAKGCLSLFDPTTDTWSQASSMNDAGAQHTATLLDSNIFGVVNDFVVLVAGGAKPGRRLCGLVWR